MFFNNEKLFKDLQEFLDAKGPLDENEFEAAVEEFIMMYNANLSEGEIDPNSPEYLLEQAFHAEDYDEAARIARQILKVDPDNIDAKVIVIKSYVPERRKRDLTKLILDELAKLGKQIGKDNLDTDLYYLHEARPLLRAMNENVDLLQGMGKLKKAIEQAEAILFFNPNDNMGVRYHLMRFYTILEDIDGAKKLYDSYKGDSSILLEFTIAMLYYKIDDLTNARKHLRLSYKSNKNIKDFLDDTLDPEDDEFMDYHMSGVYSPGEISEVACWININNQLIDPNLGFLNWAHDEMKKIARGSKKKRKKR